MTLGMPEMIFIFLLALVVVGPRKLPELGRQLGKFLAEFKRASNEFRNQLEAEMLNIELQEGAKKQEEASQLLPPEEPWQRLMRPITESVSRTQQEFASVVKSNEKSNVTSESELVKSGSASAQLQSVAPPADRPAASADHN